MKTKMEHDIAKDKLQYIL